MMMSRRVAQPRTPCDETPVNIFTGPSLSPVPLALLRRVIWEGQFFGLLVDGAEDVEELQAGSAGMRLW
jgi:hypothetical protein